MANVKNYGQTHLPVKSDFNMTSSSRFIRRYSIDDDRKNFISAIDEALVKKTWPKNSAVSTRPVKILNQNEIDR